MVEKDIDERLGGGKDKNASAKGNKKGKGKKKQSIPRHIDVQMDFKGESFI